MRGARKWLIAAGLLAAIVVVVVLVSGGGGSNGYVVRGIFDSGSFMVSGEEVRVAGATVGEIESVGVTMPGEIDGYENGKPIAVPGKAVLAMKITDPNSPMARDSASTKPVRIAGRSSGKSTLVKACQRDAPSDAAASSSSLSRSSRTG